MNSVENEITDKDDINLTKDVKENKKDEDQYLSITPFVITSVATMVVTLLLAFGGFKYWESNYQQRILTVKMSDVLSNHILEIGASRLSEDQKAEYALRWSAALDDTIQELTKDNRTIVLTQNASIAGVEDFTEFVEVSAKKKVGGINSYGQQQAQEH